MSASLRAQSTPGELTNLSSAGSDRTLATSTGGSSHTHSHRKHHHHHRSRSAPRAPEKPPRKRHMNPGHSLASIPSQIKLSMLNSGLISFDGGLKSQEITNAILFFIAKNNLPFGIVESEGFVLLMRKSVPLYKPPSRKTITRLMKERFEGLSTVIKNELKNIDDICLTTDVWTDSTTRSFLGVTAHYLLNEKCKSINISVEQLSERDTADYLNDVLLNFISAWNINKDSIVAIVSDSAANIKKAISNAFGIEKHLPYLANLLNLVPSEIIQHDEVVTPLISRIKDIVTFFKKFVVAADKLRELSDLKIIQSVDTRWNSVFLMLKRFVELTNIVSTILLSIDNGPNILASSELKVIKEFITLLEPFYETTHVISEEKYFTGSKAIPSIKAIKYSLNIISVTTDSALRLKQLLSEDFSKRFGSIEEVNLLARATLLDPRFKKLYFENHLAYSKALKNIMRCLSNSITDSSRTKTDCHSIVKNANNEQKSFIHFHKMMLSFDKSKKVEETTKVRCLKNYVIIYIKQ